MIMIKCLYTSQKNRFKEYKIANNWKILKCYLVMSLPINSRITRRKTFLAYFILFAVFFGRLKFIFTTTFYALKWVQRNNFFRLKHFTLPFSTHSSIFATGFRHGCVVNGMGKLLQIEENDWFELTLVHKLQWDNWILV